MTRLRPSGSGEAGAHEERIRAVVDCGFTERQARFLVLVMRHGGVCIPRQYASFAGIANGGRRCNAFFDKLVKRGYAHEIRCVHNRAITSITSRSISSSGKRRAVTAGKCRRGSQSSA
jgi:hypothetical protein